MKKRIIGVVFIALFSLILGTGCQWIDEMRNPKPRVSKREETKKTENSDYPGRKPVNPFSKKSTMAPSGLDGQLNETERRALQEFRNDGDIPRPSDSEFEKRSKDRADWVFGL